MQPEKQNKLFRGQQSPILLDIYYFMISHTTITELVKSHLEPEFFIVDITIQPTNKIHVLLDGDNGITITKCIEVSRLIENSLDREEEDFSLEVSSPGLGQPLKLDRQYAKNTGRKIEVVFNDGEKIVGKLLSATEDDIDVQTTERQPVVGKKKTKKVEITRTIMFEDIKQSKIVPDFSGV